MLPASFFWIPSFLFFICVYSSFYTVVHEFGVLSVEIKGEWGGGRAIGSS